MRKKSDGDEEEKGLKIFSGEGVFHAAAGRWCLCQRGRLMGFSVLSYGLDF